MKTVRDDVIKILRCGGEYLTLGKWAFQCHSETARPSLLIGPRVSTMIDTKV